MPSIRTDQVSFGGGEITPEMFGRVDDSKYQTGLALCRNFMVKPWGPIANRRGTTYVSKVKYSNKKTRLIPFTYSTSQTMAIEFGAGYLRFHTNAATLLAGSPVAWSNATAYVLGDLVSSGGVNYYCILAHTNHVPPNVTYWYALPTTGEYEIPHSYVEADLFDVHYVQSSDVLTLVHPNYPPQELRRMGATNWQFSTIITSPTTTTPGAPTVTPTLNGATNTTSASYVVTAALVDGKSESLASPSGSGVNNLLNTGSFNTISWSAVTGAAIYNVYKLTGGLYGYIGQTASLSIIDDNITPDISKTPPNSRAPFVGTGNYPAAVSYYEQRRVFGGSVNLPQNIWMTRSGTESDLSYSIPSRDDDGIVFRVAAREANTIRHIVPLSNLVLLTSAAEWRVTSLNSDAVTPTSISVKPQSYIGASNVQPVIVNTNLIYAAARGGHMREMAYSWQANGFTTGDLSLRAPHLFDGITITDMAYGKSPFPIVWATNSNGQLLGCTYVPEQQVGPWHRHDSYTLAGQSLFESVCVVAEGQIDAAYMIVNRTINSQQVRLVEWMGDRAFGGVLADAYFVDCGATYSGSPATTVSGLSWLEGETVSILADGAVSPPQTVTGGIVTVPVAASTIHVGLPITADAQTMPISYQTQGYGQGRQKNANKVWLRVNESSGIFAGPSFTALTPAKQRTDEPYGSPPDLKTAEVPIVISPSWGDNGQICVRQSDPLPLTLTSMSIELSIGS